MEQHERSGILEILETSQYESFNVHRKPAYINTSHRSESEMIQAAVLMNEMRERKLIMFKKRGHTIVLRRQGKRAGLRDMAVIRLSRWRRHYSASKIDMVWEIASWILRIFQRKTLESFEVQVLSSCWKPIGSNSINV